MPEVSHPLALEIPSGVSVTAIMDFLKRGQGYVWSVLSRGPVPLLLGHPPRSNLPEVIVISKMLFVNPGDDIARGRFVMMLDLLNRQNGGHS
ncbi:MAG: hypothetical protein DRO87_06525 [Candidatus Thorarchaeota archaeon]|nr:MAG: hypothetical protein DRO87_06525 [Candidatus Thorarchaeota archaeon]RLI58292.1 MAG: hypothetical protein DRP09_00725 [Candidatus Thorarchaeota archaeon]